MVLRTIGVLKRGKPYRLTWSGGREDNVLLFELYRGDTKVKVFEERPNVANTILTVPTDVRPDKEYRLKISDIRNRDEVVYTGTFELKRKFPLSLKSAFGLVVGGGIAFAVTNLDSSAGDKEIVDPPNLN